jgi:hypothetical protein
VSSRLPPSLGDENKATYRLIQESFPMPEGRKALLAGIEQILVSGGVQKLIVRVGHPLQVVRAVKEGTVEPVPTELIDDDLMAAVRNCEMEEFPIAQGVTPYEYLFRAFLHLNKARVEGMSLQPKVFIFKKLEFAKQWLGQSYLPDIFGVEITQHAEMPEDGLLFVAASATDIEDVKFSLRMEIDLQWRTK